MCGIVGKVYRNRELVEDASLLARMMHAIRCRGTDGEGHVRKAPLALGFTRLAIIGKTGGDQPIPDETGNVILVCNGEIYNHRALRKRLEGLGHVFRGTSDAEVIVHGYEQWGTAVAEHLEGMFAFALFDHDRNRLVLGRDRFGKKSLFYSIVDKGRPTEAIIFGSSLRALMADPALERAVRPHGVEEYLTCMYVPEPNTILRDVFHLPAAHVMIYESGQLKAERYWSLEYEPKSDLTEEEAAAAVREQLEESVRKRLESEAPLGFLLSAGIDSAAVATLARPHVQGPMYTFTACMKGARHDERNVSRTIAESLGSQHHEFEIDPNPAESLSQIPWHYGQPNGHRAAVAYLYLFRHVSQHAKVLLSGDGGDEFFAGYVRQRTLKDYPRLRRKPLWMRRAALSMVEPLTDQFTNWAGAARLRHRLRSSMLSSDDLFVQSYTNFLSWQRPVVLTKDFARASIAEGGRPEAIYEEIINSDLAVANLDRRMAAEALVMMPGLSLARLDSMSMAQAVEVRSPFLDHEFAGFAARLPADYKMRNGELKWILKRALSDVLPTEFLSRKKIGFGNPGPDFFEQAFKQYVPELLLDSTSRERGILNVDHVAALLRQHQAGVGGHDHRLWSLLILESWMRTFIDRANPTEEGPLELGSV